MGRSFHHSLTDGHRAERAWVENLRRLGRSVAHGRKLVIKHHDKNTGHVESPDAVGLVSIEIKERSLTFTTPESYPYDTVFVDDLRGIGRETVRHLAYVYLSRSTGRWVWLSPMDRDGTWREEVTFDRGRGHEVPVLVAPKRFLRPAQQLIDYLYPHHLLGLVDGDTNSFLQGGGETEERDRYVAQTHPDFGGRDRPPAPEAGKHLG